MNKDFDKIFVEDYKKKFPGNYNAISRYVKQEVFDQFTYLLEEIDDADKIRSDSICSIISGRIKNIIKDNLHPITDKETSNQDHRKVKSV